MTILDTILAVIHTLVGGSMSKSELEVKLDAKAKGRNLNWRESIVDLLKLIGQDSSETARIQMAKQLGYPGPYTDDNAQMNVWLISKVMARLERNY